jgi:hypothetical protein
VSTALSSSGMAAADSSMNVTGIGIRSATCRAIAMSRGAGSRPHDFVHVGPVERQVQPRSDTDLQHSSFRRGDHPFSMRHQAPVAHHEMAEPW